MMNNKVLYVTAGEESGDLLGSEVIRNMKNIRPDIAVKGIGGEKMIIAGLVPVFRTEKLGFMGFFELIKNIFVIRKAFQAILRNIIEDRPSAVLMIDFSEFHMKLAKKIRKISPGTKIIKYVSPQIWASRQNRINDIVEFYDCLCCILPFEPEIYRGKEIDCRYVGHPLMDTYNIRMEYSDFCAKFGLSEEKTLISVFPGSRSQEIKKHMPVIVEFIKRISAADKNIEIAVCRSGNLPVNIFEKYEIPSEVKVIPSGYQWDVMAHSGIVLCKSGTSTLQAAIAGTPSVVFYKVNPFSYFIAKKIVKTKFISLPNIISGKMINPELIQSDFNPDNLISEVNKLLENDDIYALRKNELETVKDVLGEKGAAQKVFQAVLDYI